MDNYLTLLYFEKFELTKEEESLMINNTFSVDENGVHEKIRNDQKIRGVRHQQEMLKRLIIAYVKKIKDE